MRHLLLPRSARARAPRPLAMLVPAAAVAVIAAGCGGGAGSGSTSASPTVAVRQTSLGRIIVDSSGRTLYLFDKDKGMKSTCYGSCASLWPPLTIKGKPTAGAGVAAAKLGTSKRTDGTTEVTFAGHPLYTYAGDTKPGDVSGEGLDQFGAEWDALTGAGKSVEHG